MRDDGSTTPYECSLLLPLRNGLETTARSLQALAQCTRDVRFELILVDDGTTDGTAELCAAISGDVQVLRNPKRTSYAAAYNQAARVARSPWLVFLRHNVAPLPGWLRALLDAAMDDREAGVVGSRLVRRPGVIHHAGVVFSRQNRPNASTL